MPELHYEFSDFNGTLRDAHSAYLLLWIGAHFSLLLLLTASTATFARIRPAGRLIPV
jgi:hypothetical protein